MVARLVLCKPLPGEEKTPTYRAPLVKTASRLHVLHLGGVHVLHRLDLKQQQTLGVTRFPEYSGGNISYCLL